MANYIWPEITVDTPIEEVKRIHQQIWDYVIEHGNKPKTPYICNCVACEYKSLHKCPCYDCPIVWPESDNNESLCTLFNSLYSKWRFASGEEKTELARQIRDIPWKFETEENTPL